MIKNTKDREQATCIDCLFSFRGKFDDEFRCHRYPPTTTGAEDNDSEFPIVVESTDWCGEFRLED